MSSRPTTPQRVVDGLVGAFYLVVLAVSGRLTDGQVDPTAALVWLVFAGGLVLRRWSPSLALGLAWAGAILQMVLGSGPALEDVAILPVMYSSAAYGTRAVRWSGFASAVLGGIIAGVFLSGSQLTTVGDSGRGGLTRLAAQFGIVVALTSVTLLLAWTVGVLVRTAARSRSDRLTAEEASREVVVEQERTRIARDMHDVVAHSLAVVIAQSDGARLIRATDPVAADEALSIIGATARAALADVRVLLQQLRYEGTTLVQPTLAELDGLVEQFRASGLRIDLDRSGGAADLSTAVQLAAFRIVQESLTNALRHGDPDRAIEVQVRRTDRGLELGIVNALPVGRGAQAGSSGQGLIGMRERAAIVQGHLSAVSRDGRFVVRAWLPEPNAAALEPTR